MLRVMIEIMVRYVRLNELNNVLVIGSIWSSNGLVLEGGVVSGLFGVVRMSGAELDKFLCYTVLSSRQLVVIRTWMSAFGF